MVQICLEKLPDHQVQTQSRDGNKFIYIYNVKNLSKNPFFKPKLNQLFWMFPI